MSLLITAVAVVNAALAIVEGNGRLVADKRTAVVGGDVTLTGPPGAMVHLHTSGDGGADRSVTLDQLSR